MHQIVVIGDVHHHLWLAVEGLERIEAETERAIDQVFSVGDLGLFLDEDDWRYPTGPSKYRRPEESKRICEAWKRWRWPLAAIAGARRPEAEIVQSLNPGFVCCGYHHASAIYNFADSTVHALNIVASKTNSHLLNPGRATIFDWDGSHLINPCPWPKRP